MFQGDNRPPISERLLVKKRHSATGDVLSNYDDRIFVDGLVAVIERRQTKQERNRDAFFVAFRLPQDATTTARNN